MNHALSAKEMLEYLPQANLLTYPQLAEMVQKGATIDEVLGESGVCILLYLWKDTYGHWTCLLRRRNTIEYFDSLSAMPDQQLKKVPSAFRGKSKQNHTYLLKLLLNCPYSVEYNEMPLQSADPTITTCGRWVILRIAFSDLPLEDFQQLFQGVKNRDEIITSLFR